MNFGCVQAKRRTIARAGALAGIAATVIVALSSPAEAARRKRSAGAGGYSPPYASMVVDVRTGRVLHAENEDDLRYPASITKVMTLYLLFEQLERGRIALETPLRVTANAAAQPPSKLSLDAGETIAVEDAIKALVTKSANDVAVVVAENVAGSVDAFADMMTRKARELGMSRTTYRNPSGSPIPNRSRPRGTSRSSRAQSRIVSRGTTAIFRLGCFITPGSLTRITTDCSAGSRVSTGSRRALRAPPGSI
jgi:D-alanyl-D-alanine carboxypeptidase